MKKLLFFLVALVLFINVNAATFDVTANSYVNGYQFPNWWDVTASGGNADRQLTVRYDDWQLLSQMSSTGYASYGYLYLCASNPFTVVSPPVCTVGCFGASLNLVSLGGTCTTGEGSATETGSYYFLFYTVDSWTWNQEHTLPYFSDIIRFSTTYNRSRITFYSNTLTDTDYYVQYASNNQMNILQEETNSKLDSINSAINSQTGAINNQTNAINNQTNAINNQTNSINNQTNSILDDNISGNNSSSFFSNFSDTDNGGISSVITAPLSFVRSITGTCSPVSFTIFNQTIALPCGDTLFWGREDVSSFRTIWNVLVGGAFVYLLLSQVFKTIENLKDPDSDKVEVMKL